MKRKLKKLFLAGLLVGLVVWAVPFFTGYLVENKYKDILNVLSDFDAVTLTPLEYHRGWLSSTATSRLTLEDPGFQRLYQTLSQDKEHISPPNNKLVIKLQHEILHGPFIRETPDQDKKWRFAQARVKTRLFLTEESKELLNTMIGTTELLKVETEIALKGSVDITLQGPSLTFKDTPKAPPSTWKGMIGKWKLDKDLKTITGELVVPGFDLDIHDAHVFAQDLLMKIHWTKIPEGLWTGQEVFRMQALEVLNDLIHSPVKFAGINGRAEVNQKENLVDSTFAGKVDKFELAGQKGGPFEGVFFLKNIDAAVFTLLKEFEASDRNNGSLFSEWKAVNKLIDFLPEILVNRPTFQIDKLHLVTNDGALDARFMISMGGPDIQDIRDPKAIWVSTQAEGMLVLQKSLLKKILEEKTKAEAPKLSQADVSKTALAQLKKWEDAQIFVQKDQNYILKLEIKSGKLFINGVDFLVEKIIQPEKPKIPAVPEAKKAA